LLKIPAQGPIFRPPGGLALVSISPADGPRWITLPRARRPRSVQSRQAGENGKQMNRRFSQQGSKGMALVLLVLAAVLAGGVLVGCGSDSKSIQSGVEKQIEKGNETAEKIVEESTKEAQEQLKQANKESGAASKQAKEADKQTEEIVEEANAKAKKGFEEGKEKSNEIMEEVNKQVEEATP
jgi:uncharacterized protein HemX